MSPHEIRNPLSTLSLNLDLLEEDFQGAESPRDRRIKQQRIGRTQAGSSAALQRPQELPPVRPRTRAENRPTDLNALVEELCDFYEPQAATLGIVVRTYFSPDLPDRVIDADLFKQAVLNLMLNAEHAMAEGGELIMTTRREGRWIVLDVIDTGTGVPKEHPDQDLRPLLLDSPQRQRPGSADHAEDRRGSRRDHRGQQRPGQGVAGLAPPACANAPGPQHS